jgi:hypothetical protein
MISPYNKNAKQKIAHRQNSSIKRRIIETVAISLTHKPSLYSGRVNITNTRTLSL